MALSNRYYSLEGRDLGLTEYRFHIYSKENSVRKLFYNFGGRSNGRIKSYGPFEPVLLSGATRPPSHQVAIPHLLQGKQRPVTLLQF
jgi:hypothetical protein